MGGKWLVSCVSRLLTICPGIVLCHCANGTHSGEYAGCLDMLSPRTWEELQVLTEEDGRQSTTIDEYVKTLLVRSNTDIIITDRPLISMEASITALTIITDHAAQTQTTQMSDSELFCDTRAIQDDAS